MRATLTIDNDLAGLLQRKSREPDKPFREILNTALRRGLAEAGSVVQVPMAVVRPHDFGGTRPGVDTDRFN